MTFSGESLDWVIKKYLKKKKCERKAKEQYLGGKKHYEKASLLFQLKREAKAMIPVDTKSLQRSCNDVLILVSKTSQIALKIKLQWPLFVTSLFYLPGDFTQTSLRCLKTSSRPTSSWNSTFLKQKKEP